MKIYDISRTLQDAPVYPGDDAPEIRPVPPTSPARCSIVTANSHAGTHADAESHYFSDGRSIDAMPLENYCGPCRVLTVPGGELIKLDDLQGRLGGVQRLALHTGGDAFLCEQAAEYIVSCGIRAVVTDAVSIGPADNEAMIHGLLMNGGVAIIENAVLDDVADGDYLLFAFPAKYGGCDGAPVRAVLLGRDPAPAEAPDPDVVVEVPGADDPDIDFDDPAAEAAPELDLGFSVDPAGAEEEISPSAPAALDNPEEQG